MVGELMIIFGLDPVIIMLGILCQLFIFFQHLRCVAARPVVDPILIIITVAIIALRTVVIIPPPTTALGLAHIHRD